MRHRLVTLTIGINFTKHKWLVIGLCEMLLRKLSSQLGVLPKNYNNIVLLGGFNISAKNPSIKDFCNTNGLQNFSKKKKFSSKAFRYIMEVW